MSADQSRGVIEAQAVQRKLAMIKAHMPEVYSNIQHKATVLGDEAFALVRRGLRGEAGCFYAFEAGYVVGTPFGRTNPHMVGAANFLVDFGCAHVCIWPEPLPGVQGGVADGTA